MSRTAYVYLGESGVVIDDVSLRVYADGVAQSIAGTALDETDAPGYYALSGLPNNALSSTDYVATMEYPEGVWRSLQWGRRQPTSVVIPVRESGHTLSSLGIVVTRDGTPYTSLTLTEIGSPGDYLLRGWPRPAYGEQWNASWTAGGITFSAPEWGTPAELSVGTRYLWITAMQEPFEIGKDSKDRVIFSCNFEARAAAPVVDWEREIVRLISDAGLGTFGGDVFVGSAFDVPDGAGPYVTIINTGGGGPVETHDSGKYTELSAQILVRASTYEAARLRARSIHAAIDGTRNTTVVA